MKYQAKGKIAANIILLAITALMIVPLLTIVNISFKSEREYLRYPNQIVQDIQWMNYVTAWTRASMAVHFKNSVLLAGGSAVLGCLVAGLAAFPIGRAHLKRSNWVFFFIMASIFFPGSLVATIYFMRITRLYNSLLGLILLQGLGGLQLHIFMFTGFVKGVPRELDEAAWIDGCGYFRYMLQVAFPLMTPIITTVFMLRFIGSWNDFISPYLFILDKEKRPLTSGLYLFMGSYANKWTLLSACIIIIAIPVIVLYVFLQRFIIEGMTSGAIKG